MTSKRYWRKIVDEFKNLLKEVKEEKNVQISGVSFRVLPGVFSPIYSSDTAWFARKIIPLTKNKKFLEIGCGAGVISCLASINGALYVVATDINPEAIKNTQLNAKFHSLDIAVREGDLFDPLPNNELFDVIFWNHPFFYTDEKNFVNDMISVSVCDEKYKSLIKFFQEGKNYLSKNGQLILGSSNIARVNLIKEIARKNSSKLVLLEKKEVPVYKGKKVKMDLRLYSITYTTQK